MIFKFFKKRKKKIPSDGVIVRSNLIKYRNVRNSHDNVIVVHDDEDKKYITQQHYNHKNNHKKQTKWLDRIVSVNKAFKQIGILSLVLYSIVFSILFFVFCIFGYFLSKRIMSYYYSTLIWDDDWKLNAEESYSYAGQESVWDLQKNWFSYKCLNDAINEKHKISEQTYWENIDKIINDDDKEKYIDLIKNIINIISAYYDKENVKRNELINEITSYNKSFQSIINKADEQKNNIDKPTDKKKLKDENEQEKNDCKLSLLWEDIKYEVSEEKYKLSFDLKKDQSMQIKKKIDHYVDLLECIFKKIKFAVSSFTEKNNSKNQQLNIINKINYINSIIDEIDCDSIKKKTELIKEKTKEIMLLLSKIIKDIPNNNYHMSNDDERIKCIIKELIENILWKISYLFKLKQVNNVFEDYSLDYVKTIIDKITVVNDWKSWEGILLSEKKLLKKLVSSNGSNDWESFETNMEEIQQSIQKYNKKSINIDMSVLHSLFRNIIPEDLYHKICLFMKHNNLESWYKTTSDMVTTDVGYNHYNDHQMESFKLRGCSDNFKLLSSQLPFIKDNEYMLKPEKEINISQWYPLFTSFINLISQSSKNIEDSKKIEPYMINLVQNIKTIGSSLSMNYEDDTFYRIVIALLSWYTDFAFVKDVYSNKNNEYQKILQYFSNIINILLIWKKNFFINNNNWNTAVNKQNTNITDDDLHLQINSLKANMIKIQTLFIGWLLEKNIYTSDLDNISINELIVRHSGMFMFIPKLRFALEKDGYLIKNKYLDENNIKLSFAFYTSVCEDKQSLLMDKLNDLTKYTNVSINSGVNGINDLEITYDDSINNISAKEVCVMYPITIKEIDPSKWAFYFSSYAQSSIKKYYQDVLIHDTQGTSTNKSVSDWIRDNLEVKINNDKGILCSKVSNQAIPVPVIKLKTATNRYNVYKLTENETSYYISNSNNFSNNVKKMSDKEKGILKTSWYDNTLIFMIKNTESFINSMLYKTLMIANKADMINQNMFVENGHTVFWLFFENNNNIKINE